MSLGEPDTGKLVRPVRDSSTGKHTRATWKVRPVLTVTPPSEPHVLG
jgi:hypothetical protein